MDGLFPLLAQIDLLRTPSILEHVSIVDDVSLRHWFGTRRPSDTDAFHRHFYVRRLTKARYYSRIYYSALLHAVISDRLSYVSWCLESDKMERYGNIAARVLFLIRYCKSPDTLAVIRSLYEKGICRFDGREVDIIDE